MRTRHRHQPTATAGVWAPAPPPAAGLQDHREARTRELRDFIALRRTALGKVIVKCSGGGHLCLPLAHTWRKVLCAAAWLCFTCPLSIEPSCRGPRQTWCSNHLCGNSGQDTGRRQRLMRCPF